MEAVVAVYCMRTPCKVAPAAVPSTTKLALHERRTSGPGGQMLVLQFWRLTSLDVVTDLIIAVVAIIVAVGNGNGYDSYTVPMITILAVLMLLLLLQKQVGWAVWEQQWQVG